MESSHGHVEEDANISTFRKRNNLILLVLLFLIFSLALIIAAALILKLRRIDRTSRSSHHQLLISPISEFCSVSNPPFTCLSALDPIITNTFIVDPDQIFTISLQAAADDLQNMTISTEFNNCSDSLRLGLRQLGGPLATMRVNPFLVSLTAGQRGDIVKRISAAEEGVKPCFDLSEGGGAATAKLAEVEVYLNSAKDFLVGYDKVLLKRRRIELNLKFSEKSSIIYDNLFGIFGLQLLFMFGMFCALFRIRKK